jgi:topoisomerase-4 subunit A
MAAQKNKNAEINQNDSGIHGQYKNWFLDYASYVILERAVPSKMA